MQTFALSWPPLIVNAAVEIAKALLVNVPNKLPAAPATVAVAYTTPQLLGQLDAADAVTITVMELAAICVARLNAIACVDDPTLNWFAVNEETAAVN